MRKLKMVLTMVITLLVLLIPCLDCYATFYDSSFPTFTGLQSGYYIEFSCNMGNDCVVFLQESDIGKISLTTNNQFFNVTGGSINCTMFVNANIHPARINARSFLQMGNYTNTGSVSGTYYDLTDMVIKDTNIDFTNVNPDSLLANSNFYFTKFEVAILSVSISVLFFTILNWWLLHERRIKSH